MKVANFLQINDDLRLQIVIFCGTPAVLLILIYNLFSMRTERKEMVEKRCAEY